VKKITLKLKKSKMNSSIISPKTFKQVSSLVFIDGGVEDIQQLFDGVVAEAKAFVMDTVTDGIEQISEILQQYPGSKTVEIICHGSPGCLYLGNTQLSLDTLTQYAPRLQLWDIDNLVLYGCNVAAGDGGREFLERLHRVMGVNVAATAGLTGSLALGGDWQLEVNAGNVDLRLPFRQDAIATYGHILWDNTVDTAKNMGAWAQFKFWKIGLVVAIAMIIINLIST
jgi:hypothetical protein